MDATDYPPREFLFEQRFAKIEIIVGIILLLVGVYQAVSLYRKDMARVLGRGVRGRWHILDDVFPTAPPTYPR